MILSGVKVGLIGCGNMGSAIVEPLVRRGWVAPDDLHVCGRGASAAGLAERLGCRVEPTPTAVVQACEVTILAVKPKDMLGMLGGVAWPEAPRVLVSVAAGLSVGTLQEAVPSQHRVIRTMPNTPIQVGAGVTAVLRGSDEAAYRLAAALFEASGIVTEVRDEALFDAVTGLSGSGPAYIFLALEALADGGVKAGLSREVAMRLALHTVRGAAELAIQTQTHPGALKDAVASPGGTTIHAVASLEAAGFRSALIEAVGVAAARSRAMSRPAGDP